MKSKRRFYYPNNFPVVIQLIILTLILAGTFWFFKKSDNQKQSIITTIPQDERYKSATTILSAVKLRQKDFDEAFTKLNIVAQAAIVWDVNNQTALYKREPNKELPLASITKLMTALLSHELVKENKIMSINIDAIRQDGNQGLVAGEKIKAELLSNLALVSSSNDAAYAMAFNIGKLLGDKNPLQQFVTAMNIRAQELNLKTMRFYNPTGLDIENHKPGAVGSARDVALLTEYIIKHYPEIISDTSHEKITIYDDNGKPITVNNTNIILKKIPGLIGSKTGFTDLAGGNLMVVFDAGYNRPIIVVVLKSTYSQRFEDVLKLVNTTRSIIGQTK